MIINKKFAEVAGWYGTAAIVAGYILVSFGVILAEGFIFQILNLTGALSLIPIALVKKVRQSVVLNIFWGTIAIFALINIVLSIL